MASGSAAPSVGYAAHVKVLRVTFAAAQQGDQLARRAGGQGSVLNVTAQAFTLSVFRRLILETVEIRPRTFYVKCCIIATLFKVLVLAIL
jgi:hypothetical protein